MELDEIKNVWSDLNKRLEQTEVLNKRMITEMLNSRQQSAKDKLMRYEVAFLILCIVFTGVTLTLLWSDLYAVSTIILMEAVFVIAGVWQVYKIYLLNKMRIDTCTTAQLLQQSIRYKVLSRIRKNVGLILVVPIFVLLVLLDPNFHNWPAMIGVIIGGSVGLGIGLLLFFRKMKNIDSLVKSYKDLKEFENE